jgi:glycine cleavage system H protein
MLGKLAAQRTFTMLYAKSHVWIKYCEDSRICKMGITDTAESYLGDIVYMELPKVGTDIEAGEELGALDSDHFADSVRSPVSGCVLEVNEAVSGHPEVIEDSPEKKGWIAKIEIYDPTQLDNLMTKQEYDAWCQ